MQSACFKPGILPADEIPINTPESVIKECIEGIDALIDRCHKEAMDWFREARFGFESEAAANIARIISGVRVDTGRINDILSGAEE